MALSTLRWSESWRVLAYSAAAALAFFVLERLEFALFDLVGADRLLALTRSKAGDDRLAAQARDLAERSTRSAAALPSGHRLAAFRLGYETGWASEYAGSFAMSDAPTRARAAQIVDSRVALAREQARRVGIDGSLVVALPSRTLTDFVRLQDRFEADENGIAERIEQRSRRSTAISICSAPTWASSRPRSRAMAAALALAPAARSAATRRSPASRLRSGSRSPSTRAARSPAQVLARHRRLAGRARRRSRGRRCERPPPLFGQRARDATMKPSFQFLPSTARRALLAAGGASPPAWRCRLRDAPDGTCRCRRQGAGADRAPARRDQPRQPDPGAQRRRRPASRRASRSTWRARSRDEIGRAARPVVFDAAGTSVDAVKAEQADIGFFAIDPRARRRHRASPRPMC